MPVCSKCKKEFKFFSGNKKDLLRRFGILLYSFFFLGLCIITYLVAPNFDFIGTPFLILLLIGFVVLFNAFLRHCSLCLHSLFKSWSGSSGGVSL